MSNKREDIKRELRSLREEAKPIIKFLQGTNEEEGYSFHFEYQNWYTKALRVVKVLGPDRYEEFKKFYEIDNRRKSLTYSTYVIQDYIKGIIPTSYNNFDSTSQTLTLLYNQFTILSSLESRIDYILSDIEATIRTVIIEDEIATANNLLKTSLRAAGALCGVIIETHLHKVSENHGVVIRKKYPGISDLNELLKKNNIYGTTEWRKISYLADIRNLCSHKKDQEPKKDQVEELIIGTNWLVKNVF